MPRCWGPATHPRCRGNGRWGAPQVKRGSGLRGVWIGDSANQPESEKTSAKAHSRRRPRWRPIIVLPPGGPARVSRLRNEIDTRKLPFRRELCRCRYTSNSRARRLRQRAEARPPKGSGHWSGHGTRLFGVLSAFQKYSSESGRCPISLSAEGVYLNPSSGCANIPLASASPKI